MGPFNYQPPSAGLTGCHPSVHYLPWGCECFPKKPDDFYPCKVWKQLFCLFFFAVADCVIRVVSGILQLAPIPNVNTSNKTPSFQTNPNFTKRKDGPLFPPTHSPWKMSHRGRRFTGSVFTSRFFVGAFFPVSDFGLSSFSKIILISFF